MAQEVDQKQLRKLLAEKLPQREIARRLNIPRSTLQRLIKGLDAPASSQASGSDSSNGLPVVDTGKLTPAEADAVRADFWELIEWWRERKLQRVYESTPRETARQTYHVEKRYIRLIHHEAEAEGVSITEVVNRAFRVYFKKRLNSDSRELTAFPLVRVARLVLDSCVVSSNGRYWSDETPSITHR